MRVRLVSTPTTQNIDVYGMCDPLLSAEGLGGKRNAIEPENREEQHSPCHLDYAEVPDTPDKTESRRASDNSVCKDAHLTPPVTERVREDRTSGKKSREEASPSPPGAHQDYQGPKPVGMYKDDVDAGHEESTDF